MAMPHILLVPGFWEGPTVWENVAARLSQEGFETSTAKLVSTGTTSPGNPSMKDDVTSIRNTLLPLVESGKEVVLVLHSAGGFLGSEAMEGLDVSTRQKAGERGGVVKIIFFTAGVTSKGHMHGDLPFAYEKEGGLYCKDVRNAFFHDVSEADTDRWMAVLQPQPAQGWNAVTNYCGWEAVPSVYVIASQDAILPVQLQQYFADTARSGAVESVDAGHLLMLSKPEEVIRLISKHAKA